jgi:hypothetical protein
MKAKDIKVGMRYRETDEEFTVDSRVVDVDHLVSTRTGVTRGVEITLEDGSTIHWMDPNKEVPEVS